MKKNAFTLIELLAVIIILAIILAIAIPSITNIIESSQVNALKSDEKMLLKAAKLYVGTNDSALPVNIGDTKEIALNTLQSAGYLATIKDPVDRTTACDGYIIITKVGTSDYDYTPYLNCENNIGSSSADGLAAHYQFDDFQEPTVNLVSSPFNFSTGYSGSISAVNTGSLNFTGENNAWTLTGSAWFARVGNSGVIGTQYTTTWYLKAGTANQVGLSWGGAHGGNRTTFTVNLTTGNVTNLSLVSGEYYNVQAASNGFWEISYSSTLLSSTNYYPELELSSGSIIVGAIQIEQKPYNTPFYNGTRTGTVKDYSGKGKNATLALSSTPKWNNDSQMGEGAYTFNGTNTYIDFPSDIVTVANIRTKGITYTAWVKPAAVGNQRIVGQQTDTGYSDYSSGGLGISSSGNAQMIAYSDANPSGYIFATGTTTLQTNQWYLLVGTFNPTDGLLRIYVNGKLEGTPQTIGTFSRLYTNATNRIGGKNHSTTPLYFNGTIDDIRIYNRVLTADEIKQLYNSGK